MRWVCEAHPDLRIVFDAEAILKSAEKDSRGLNPDETKAYDELLEKQLPQVKAQIAKLQRVDEFTAAVTLEK